jgi:benzoyl-CoA reductase/2-hydroxyglutaryl-CoA dehydratase subunit BcrC/BadD/HgdB
MKTVAYASPWVPPEWIAAHGLRPHWARLGPAKPLAWLGAGRGVCPFAGALVETTLGGGSPPAAVVLTTACDQMRYAAALVEQIGNFPVFLMNVPSTWQTAAARQLYRDEVERLGRFLVRLGGASPSADELKPVMLEYDRARSAIRQARPRLSARRFAEALVNLRGGINSAGHGPPSARQEHGPGVPLALLGGPLVEQDYALLDAVEQAGGRVVLNATESGERTLPAPLDPGRLRDDPLDAMVEAYFAHIPDVFRRPNHRLYDWLAGEVAERGVRGLLLRRYLWCDLWHAELPRLRQRSAVPVLELDAVDDEPGSLERTLGRIEAFLEILR